LSLHAGAKAGIALGAIFGVAIVAALIFLGYRLGKRKQHTAALVDNLDGGHGAPEVVQVHFDGTRIRDVKELDGTMVHKYEMEAGVPVK
jgi:hypothetical protein